ncbi:hypothetical protein M3A49_38360 [Paraburkholderia sp. CNPSo 3076]|uniref:hypothetical protein n=1 Tax=Paraburkholderia sp. CNPSo 3076 TaxID=2940936 RepID=UPI0022532473|nr:hypothetical protein [Paraburkholderia sp. CNPSo 3076]MCX5545243.1 hypothetical protein [Paraburkholderia sp. CNPSo 3076]
MQTNTTSNLHSATTDALYQYMVDCRFDISHMNSMTLSMAIEYVYQPHPRFWRDFDVQDLSAAMTMLIPNWETVLEDGVKKRLFHEIAVMLLTNAFDEANAELLLALPVEDRPTDSVSAFVWICAELQRNGRKNELAHARRDGDRSGAHALETMRILLGKIDGTTATRTGTLVAHTYRDAVMARNREHARQASKR